MLQEINITAPQELVDGIVRSEELFRLYGESKNDLVSTIQQFSKILGDTFKYDANNKFFQPSPESEQFRKELFETLVKQSNELLISELKAKGVNNVLFVTPTGMQGAGKGTNGDTNTEVARILTKPDSDEAINFFDPRGTARKERDSQYIKITSEKDNIAKQAVMFAKALEVKTGTNGIFFHADSLELCKTNEEKEYFELFHASKAALGASGGLFVESNIVAICVNLYLAHKIKQSPEGISTFNIDLYPRSSDQYVLLHELQAQLGEAKITSDHKVIDFKILPEEDIQFLRQNSDRVVAFANRLKNEKRISNFYSQIVKIYGNDSYKLSFEVLHGLVNEFFSDSNLGDLYSHINPEIEQRIVKTMLESANVAISRAKGRFEAGRGDDAPIYLIKRITDYFLKSYVNAFEAPEDAVIMISTAGDPIEVAKKTFCTLYNISPDAQEIKPHGRYYVLLENYKDLVSRKVRGSFNYEPQFRRFIRVTGEKTNKGFREIVYWNSDHTTVLYTIEATDGTKVTLKINEKGIQWFDSYGAKSNEDAWKKLESLGATKNWSYSIKNLKNFKESFRELSVSTIAR